MGGHRRRPDEHRARENEPPRDPVNGHSVDTNHAFTATFDGQTYYLESEQTRAEFNRDRKRYSHIRSHKRHSGC